MPRRLRPKSSRQPRKRLVPAALGVAVDVERENVKSASAGRAR